MPGVQDTPANFLPTLFALPMLFCFVFFLIVDVRSKGRRPPSSYPPFLLLFPSFKPSLYSPSSPPSTPPLSSARKRPSRALCRQVCTFCFLRGGKVVTHLRPLHWAPLARCLTRQRIHLQGLPFWGKVIVSLAWSPALVPLHSILRPLGQIRAAETATSSQRGPSRHGVPVVWRPRVCSPPGARGTPC